MTRLSFVIASVSLKGPASKNLRAVSVLHRVYINCFQTVIKRLLMCVEKDVQLIVDYIRSDVLYRINGVAYH